MLVPWTLQRIALLIISTETVYFTFSFFFFTAAKYKFFYSTSYYKHRGSLVYFFKRSVAKDLFEVNKMCAGVCLIPRLACTEPNLNSKRRAAGTDPGFVRGGWLETAREARAARKIN